MIRTVSGGVAAVAVAFSLTACNRAEPQQSGPPEVGVVSIRTEPVPVVTELSGRTQAFLVSEVRPQVGGVVKARLFTEGSSVRAGQPLYQIDPATYRASLDSAKAGLAQAQALQAAAKLKADRYKELVAINAVSRQDNDDAQAAAQQAAANVQAQRAAVQQAQINLDYTRVAAPISGRIGRSTVTPGALVTANQAEPLATVQSLDKIYVDVTQSTADLLRLRRALDSGRVGESPSAPVTLVLEDGSTYAHNGVLQFADVSVDEGTGSVILRAVFPNPDRLLLPGMYVRARVNMGVVPQGVLAPQIAISRDPSGKPTALVVGRGNKVELRTLETRATIGDKWLVTAGLKAGDRLIVDSLQKVQPGAVVKPVAPKAK
jgi:membrane fusion protein (multidrug efflux system)